MQVKTSHHQNHDFLTIYPKHAVLYYGNDIPAKSLPGFGPYISLIITDINVIKTFPPIILIEVL